MKESELEYKATKFYSAIQLDAFEPNLKTIIFGAGKYGEKVYNALKLNLDIVAFADNDIKKQGTLLYDIPIKSMDELVDYCDSCIIFIAISNKEIQGTIIERLNNIGFNSLNIFYFGDDRFFYPKEFYANMKVNNKLECFKIIASHVIELIGDIDSIIDVGCGNGLWLSVINKEYGLSDMQGIDGEWAQEHQLDESIFISYDLTKPFNMNRHYDLVCSIEVAEHLPESCAKSFVDSLCIHGNVILFSAAIPGQLGSNHINCQYPSWWAKLFNDNGYACVDVIRGRIVEDDDVFSFYKTNMMLYIKNDSDEMKHFIQKNASSLWTKPIDIVTPIIFYESGYQI